MNLHTKMDLTDEVQKGSQKSGGLDVKAVGKHDEVQKGSQSAPDWTLKR